jgi:cysteine desulfurase / selenocysteine lyase
MNDLQDFRSYFPFFESTNDITYLDNANTTQILGSCLSSIVKYYYAYNYNIGRASYSGARYAQQLKEWAIEAAAVFFNTKPENIFYTTGSTEGLNLIAISFCKMFQALHSNKKFTLLTTELEHASAILPWMTYGKRLIDIKYIQLNNDYSLSMDNLNKAIELYDPDILLLSSMTNTTGEIRPLEEIGKITKDKKITFIVDHSQGAAHVEVDVDKCNIDFLTCSLHKMYGPKGTGILYSRIPQFIRPMKFGGGMNKWFDKQGNFELLNTNDRLAAGTENVPNMFSAINALEFIIKNWNEIYKHDRYLGLFAHKLLGKLPKIKLYSNVSSSIVLFNIDGYEALDVMNYLDKKNIFIRGGNHCSKLTGDLFGLSTCRVSFGIYNTEEDVIQLYKALKEMEEELCLENVTEKTVQLDNVEQINVR